MAERRLERRDSIHGSGKMLSRSPSMSAFRKRRIGVLTSGGDAPGMNAALRAVVRVALCRGAEVFAIYGGYMGLVNGDIRRMEWHDVAGILQHGGTEIFTARCEAFKTREGRLKAAHNLLKLGIDSLVVIGGDGSLTGANILHTEWPDLLRELLQKNLIKEEHRDKHPRLAITGLVGSIDNDMQGADYTIGADTALHRIISAVDSLTTTASSHQRTFVVEVMGRNCGFLALMTALATGSDYVLIPEKPPEGDNWEIEMCNTLQSGRDMGRRCSIVILAEGARDKHGNRITSEQVKQAIESTLHHETRITILGHVQRGGAPSAFDRNMSTLVGAAAAEHALSPEAEQHPSVIGWLGNKPTASPLMECVQRTQEVEKAIQRKEFDRAVEMRGSHFKAALELFHTFVKSRPDPERYATAAFPKLRIGVMHVGAPSPGMNAAVRSAVRYALDHGHTMLGIVQGWKGLIAGNIKPLGWMDVNGWAVQGGCNLSSSRVHPQSDDEVRAIVANVLRYSIEAMLILGGYDAYESALSLTQRTRPKGVTEDDWVRFRKVPIVLVPCSISNNCPATEYSIGTDTALNNIMEAGDKIKQSSSAANRVFVVEVMGAYCGYLALMGAMAVGAERAYLPEEGITLASLLQDTALLIDRFSGRHRVGFLVCNEKASPVYTSQLLGEVLKEEGRGTFDVRHTILGHLQQGGAPSPLDRMYAALLSAFAVRYLWEHYAALAAIPAAGVAVGLIGDRLTTTPLEFLPDMIDRTFRRPKDQWWLQALPVFRLLAQSRPDEPVYDSAAATPPPNMAQMRRRINSEDEFAPARSVQREDEEENRYSIAARRRHSLWDSITLEKLAPLLVVVVPVLCVWLATRNKGSQGQ